MNKPLVLVVEDDRPVRNLIVTTLKSHDYRYLTAENGKTAIMEQIAAECGIGLVAYTITHHTRQSAIGLPLIDKHTFGDKEYAVTEYTMSEIIGSVYDKIEETGMQEGACFQFPL